MSASSDSEEFFDAEDNTPNRLSRLFFLYQMSRHFDIVKCLNKLFVSGN